ncbi:MAG: polysaccharide deacetylase family protein [Tepidisphaeraceae bacterium]|jgi:peptidoglycan/xylan/chitin deacetylase (PgdA/CDA1 family)
MSDRSDTFIQSAMSRFGVTSWAAIGVATAATLVLPDPMRTWAVIAVWLVYLPIFTCGLWFIGMNFFCRAECRGRVGTMKVALTFDDGPDPASTPELLELLRRERIPATFFCVGRNVAAHPELAARIVGEGHLLGNHSYRHPWFISALFGRWLSRELERGQRAIEEAAGVKARYFRPPSGMTGPHFAGALRRAGLTLVGWDVRSFDTLGSARWVIERVVRKTRDGSIVLLHDGGVPVQRMLEIVSVAVRELRLRGFEFERVDRMLDENAESHFLVQR